MGHNIELTLEELELIDKGLMHYYWKLQRSSDPCKVNTVGKLVLKIRDAKKETK